MTTIKKSNNPQKQTTVSKATTEVIETKVKEVSDVSLSVPVPKKPGRPKGAKNKIAQQVQTPPSVDMGTNAKRYEEVKKSDFVPATVSQILGEDARDKFGTSDEEEYNRKICAMSRREIFYHASQLGVPLNESLIRLRKNLITEFRKHLSTFRIPKNAGTMIGTVPKKSFNPQKVKTVQEFKDLPENIQEILDEVK